MIFIHKAILLFVIHFVLSFTQKSKFLKSLKITVIIINGIGDKTSYLYANYKNIITTRAGDIIILD